MTEREMVAVLVALLKKGKKAEAEAQALAFRDEYGSWITPKRLLQEANKLASARAVNSERTAMLKVATNDADSVLTFFDRLANAVQRDPDRFDLTASGAKVAMTYLDHVADDFERKTFGEESLHTRSAELVKEAETDIQTEPDESYMGTFENPQAPIQTESDEPYMDEFGTDTSSEVRDQYPSGSFTPHQSSANPFD